MKRFSYLINSFLMLFHFSVNGQIKADFEIVKPVICAGEIASVIAHSPTSKTFFWQYGESTTYYPTLDSVSGHRYSVPGTYIIKLMVKDGSGNSDSTEKTKRVLDYPDASFSLNQYPNNNGVFCLGTEFSISQWSNISGFDSLHWDFGDGFTSLDRSPYHTYADTGMYTITLDAVGTCGSDRYMEQVYVVDDSRGKAELNMYFQGYQYCVGAEININASLYEGNINAYTFYTGDGNSTTLDEFTYAYQAAGEYTLMGILENNCGIDTFTYDITIGDDMDNRPYLYSGNRPCFGKTSTFRIGCQNDAFASAEIDFGDGTKVTVIETYEDILHDYASAGSYSVTAIITYTNCAQPDTILSTAVVDANPNVYPFGVYTNLSSACPNEVFNINGPWIEEGDTLVYDFGDGNSQTYPDERPSLEYSYTTSGTYKITIYRTLVCGTNIFRDSAYTYISIEQNIETPLYLSASTNSELGCVGDSITLWMSSYPHDFTNQKFILPDGSIKNGESTIVSFDQVGSYPIIGVATNFCSIESKAAYTVEVIDKILNPSIDG